MAMVGLVGLRGGGGWYACGTKSRGLVACREMPEHFRVRGDTLMTPDDTDVQVRRSVQDRVGIGRSS